MSVQTCWWSVADKDEKWLVPVKTLKLLPEHFADCSFLRKEIKNRCEIESQSLVNICVSCKCSIIEPGCFNSEHQCNTGRLRWLLKYAQISPDTDFHSAAVDSGHLQSNIRWIFWNFGWNFVQTFKFPNGSLKEKKNPSGFGDVSSSCRLRIGESFSATFAKIFFWFFMVPPSLVTDKITARLVGNQSKWRWQHYSVVITLCRQYPPHKEEWESKQARDFLSAV